MVIELDVNKMTWKQVHQWIRSGYAESMIGMNAKKDLFNRHGYKIATMRLVDFDRDVDKNGDKIKTTWIASESTLRCSMNVDTNGNSTTLGGWSSSEARNYLNDYIFEQLPEDLQNAIVPAIKKSDSRKPFTLNPGRRYFPSIIQTIDKIWIPSMEEVFGNWFESLQGQGRQYKRFSESFSSTFFNKHPEEYVGDFAWSRSSLIDSSAEFLCFTGNKDIVYASRDASEELIIPISFCI